MARENKDNKWGCFKKNKTVADDLIKAMIKIQKCNAIEFISKKWYNFIEMIYFSS